MGPIRSGRTKNRREPGGPSSAMADEQTDISNTSKIKKSVQLPGTVEDRKQFPVIFVSYDQSFGPLTSDPESTNRVILPPI